MDGIVMKNATVAVITRTKNRPEFLERAMDSVLGQTYQDWIHVIINDGGNARTVDLQAAFRRDAYGDRIIVLHNEQSTGMQSASNLGINAVDSEFIVIHDDDDSWKPSFLEATVEYLKKHGEASPIQGVATQSTQVTEELCMDGTLKEIERKAYYPFEHVMLDELSCRNLFPPIAFLYRRKVHEAIGFFNQDFDVLGDHDFNLRFACRFDIGVLSAPLANYHWRKASCPNTVTRNRNLHRKMLVRMKNAYQRKRLGNNASRYPSLEKITLPPPDAQERIPFTCRMTESKPVKPFPDFFEAFQFKVLSLDVFDTVLCRRCHHPRDVFKFVEGKVKGLPGLESFPFALARRKAECLARERLGREILFDEIYEVLGAVGGLSTEQLDGIRQLELETEHEVLYMDPRWLELYQACKDKGCRVVFVSDMYLPAETIRQMLASNGIEGAEVYVSCEQDASKSMGSLQHKVAGLLEVSPADILHVGDNFRSDCIMSRLAGWQAFHWESGFRYKPWYAEIDPFLYSPDDYLSSRLMGEVRMLGERLGHTSVIEKLGREVAGPLYFCFLNWVGCQAARDKVRKLILLGRDGYYWQKALQILKGSSVEATFVHCSRKVLNFASFQQLDDRALNFLLTPNPSLRVRDFIDRTGLNAQHYLNEIAFVGFDDPEEVITSVAGGRFLEPQHSAMLRDLCWLLKADLEKKFHEDRVGIQQVLDEADYNPDDCAVVDIGWNASSLKSLAHLYDGKPVRGYFFGTWKAALETTLPITPRSFFVHLGEPASRGQLVRESVNLLESINAAPFATLSRFASGENGIVPVFNEDEVEGFSVDQQGELWKGASDFLQSIPLRLGGDYGKDAGILYLEMVLSRLMREPSPNEAETLGSLLHSEGFGVSAATRLVYPVDENTYGTDLMRAYWSSNWRKGFLTLLPEEKRQYVLEKASAGRVRSLEEIQADLKWKNKQLDLFWNEKEGYKQEIAELRDQTRKQAEKISSLKKDFHWKSGEAHALFEEKERLRRELEALKQAQPKAGDS